MDGCDAKSKVKAERLLHIVRRTLLRVVKAKASRSSRHLNVFVKNVYCEESAGFSHTDVEQLVIDARSFR